MERFTEHIRKVLNSGEEEVRTWFLVRNHYLPFVLCGCYLLFTLCLGPALMRNRKPFELRIVMIIFNFALVATYAISLAIAFWYLPGISREEFCVNYNVRKNKMTYILASLGWLAYVLKYIEFLDTVFLVLRKKDNQLSFLHIVHHTIVPLLGWLIFRTERSGVQCVPAIINAIVHVIMYTYYGLAAMGPEIRKHLWWKKYLTQLQMVQFVVIIVFMTIVAPLFNCTMVLSGYIMGAGVGPLFLYLFYRFYRANFQSKRQTGQDKHLTLVHGSSEKQE